MLPSPQAKRQRSGSDVLVSVPGRGVVWLPALAHAPLYICLLLLLLLAVKWLTSRVSGSHVSWCTSNAWPCLILEKDTGWTQAVGSVDLRLVQNWGQYQSELVAHKLSDPSNPLEVHKIGQEFLSTNISGRAPLENTKSRVREARAAHEAADAKLAKANGNANNVF